MLRTKQKINRQEKILLSLAELTYATSEQLQLINNLGGNRNARRILFEMEQDNLIKSTMHERKIYYISNKGSDFIGKGNTRLNKTEIQHALMRNDLYIELGMPPTWKKEAKLLVNDKVVLISDARFKRDNRYYFVEIDNKQAMRTNQEKIKKYSEVFKLIKKHRPQLIWYTLSSTRKERLIKECQRHAISYKFY